MHPFEVSGRRMVIAIDPGAKGAVAIFQSSENGQEFKVEKLGPSPQERFDQLFRYALLAEHSKCARIAVLEDVGGYIGIPQPGSRMFRFGQSFGQLEGCLIALQYSIMRVKPRKWQTGLGLLSRSGEKKPEHKKRLHAKALDLFPALKPARDTADALLLLFYFLNNT